MKDFDRTKAGKPVRRNPVGRTGAAMSARQQQRNAALPAMNQDKPQNYAELTARGPLQVKNQVIGTLRENGEGGVVVPDPAFRETNFGLVRIEKNHLNGAPFNMTVVCEILNPSAENRDFSGKIIEVLGDIGSSDVRMEAVLRQFGLSKTFPEAVVNEVMDLPTNPPKELVDEEIRLGRKDLRTLTTITMDGEEAKDLDDAISIRKEDDGNYRLFVHIADVSNYVRENTCLDGEARLRATSVYLVDSVIPMLPPKLSNGLCSLNPGVDRLTLTAEMVIDGNGKTIDGSVYESVIVSDARTSYNECFRLLTDEKPTDKKDYGPILPMLRDMKKLADILSTARYNRGALKFNIPETKVILADDGTVKEVKPYPINFCHGIIEEFMIAANEFIAKKFAMLNYPFVYRIHDDPDKIKISRFCAVARTFGAAGSIKGKITPKSVSDYLESVNKVEGMEALNTLLLRALAKAIYSSENKGHFGLASEYYCHFTSPIRRYPDLYIHRIIKSYIHEENKRRHFAGLVEGIAEHSSEMERNSVDAERVSVDIKVAEYMSDKVGEHFDGMISSVIAAGVFVRLKSSVEGFVPFRTMRDHYVFDERSLSATGARTGKKLLIGMNVRIVVTAVDTDTNHIDFAFENEISMNQSSSGGNTITYKRRDRSSEKTSDSQARGKSNQRSDRRSSRHSGSASSRQKNGRGRR